ncbi:MAG: PmeII family type II restriction endonuclease [Hyphomicrobiales bacterium]|nr:PmeII family type II restriction endonuclease [Hyphomicrobiales bacterium]
MNELRLAEVASFIENHIGPGFHDKKIDKVKRLTLNDVLRRKNPYLYRAKATLTANDYITAVLDATASSAEETVFGNFLERVAVFVCESVFKGRKSSAVGIDLEFDYENTRYLVAIKSGPKWGNSSSRAKLKTNFITARKTLSTSGGLEGRSIEFIEGCCYGIDNNFKKDFHRKLCGQRLWEFISGGNEQLYTQLIEPIGFSANERNDELKVLYAAKLNLFTAEFIERFCDAGVINWQRLVTYNSGKHVPIIPRLDTA